MKDVAEAAGVSVTTVSHVLNRTRCILEETVQKVEVAVRSLRFKVNPVARHLRMGESFLSVLSFRIWKTMYTSKSPGALSR